MKFERLLLLLHLALFSTFVPAQIYRSCTSTMEFEKGKDTLADAKVLKTYMIYNSGTGEFNLKIDLSSVVVVNTSNNTKFADLEDQFLLFKGNYTGPANELVTGTNDGKNRTINGMLSMNSISQPCTILVQSVNYADRTENKSLKLDILFDIDPIKLNIPVLKDMTKDIVEVEITGGFVNLVN